MLETGGYIHHINLAFFHNCGTLNFNILLPFYVIFVLWSTETNGVVFSMEKGEDVDESEDLDEDGEIDLIDVKDGQRVKLWKRIPGIVIGKA